MSSLRVADGRYEQHMRELRKRRVENSYGPPAKRGSLTAGDLAERCHCPRSPSTLFRVSSFEFQVIEENCGIRLARLPTQSLVLALLYDLR